MKQETQDETTNLRKTGMVQIGCKCEPVQSFAPEQMFRCPNLLVFMKFWPSPPQKGARCFKIFPRCSNCCKIIHQIKAELMKIRKEVFMVVFFIVTLENSTSFKCRISSLFHAQNASARVLFVTPRELAIKRQNRALNTYIN